MLNEAAGHNAMGMLQNKYPNFGRVAFYIMCDVLYLVLYVLLSSSNQNQTNIIMLPFFVYLHTQDSGTQVRVRHT